MQRSDRIRDELPRTQTDFKNNGARSSSHRRYDRDDRDRRSDHHRSSNSSNHRRWRDSYQAGDNDGSGGHTLYPVQSRTQSGTFNQYDYKNTNFKKEFNITKRPKDTPKKAEKNSDSESSEKGEDLASSMRPKEPSEPSYGLQFNDDDDSDGNQKYNYANDDALLMQQAAMNFQDDQMNMFQTMKSKKKKKRKRKANPEESENSAQQELREQAKKEWEAVKQLPAGSGELSDSEQGGSGMSGKARRGKRENKKRMKVAHIPMAPLLFQKAKGVLGDASLEKSEDKPFEEMNSEEKEEKLKDLKKEQENAQIEYFSWKRDYTSWFVDAFTMRGLLNGTDPIELLKSTEVDGFKNTDRAVQDEAAKIRQYYLTFRIVDMKLKKTEKDLEKFNKKISEENKSVD
ncbi:unnamed protein product [Oikopleura dioica]|uniref:Uncharacterized protein n=1 Tax=Oikopleura dioica TaxID=34765 RepID=E4XFQ5_OIKDI|nr:unnamed protein product [Oikopleura dioica]